MRGLIAGMLVIAGALVSSEVDAQTATSPSRTRARQQRGFHEIDRDIRAAMRQEATAEASPDRYRATVRLTSLYRELMQDPRLAGSPTLQKYKARLWRRLVDIQHRLERELSYAGGSTRDDAVAIQLTLNAASLAGPARSLALYGPPDANALGGAAIADDGWALVALIQQTIRPEFWDVHGGPGTIVYYAPLRVLVVRGTSELHHQLGGGLRALRGR